MVKTATIANPMTTTPLDYFDKTQGTLEQLVLGVITQKLINRDYIHESLATDFTTNAINYSIALDSGDNLTIDGALSISLTFPTLPYERKILTDRDSFDLRILTLNSLNVDTLSLPQKPSYPIKSVAPILPAYLSQPVVDNTLERRLMALCLYIRNYINWVDRWDNVASYWIITVINNQPFSSYPLIEIEADRDALLLELQTGITYKSIPRERTYYPAQPASSSNPATAQEQVDFFGTETAQGFNIMLGENGVSDPASSNLSPMSSSLRDELQASGNSSENINGGTFGGNQPDSPQQKEPEKPTLPNC